MSRSEKSLRLVGQESDCCLIHVKRPADEEEARPVGKLMERMGPGFQLRHRFHEQRLLLAAEAQLRRYETGQPLVVGFADIMAVQILELLEIEAGRRLADLRKVEPFDCLFPADDFVVAMSPAKSQQV